MTRLFDEYVTQEDLERYQNTLSKIRLRLSGLYKVEKIEKSLYESGDFIIRVNSKDITVDRIVIEKPEIIYQNAYKNLNGDVEYSSFKSLLDAERHYMNNINKFNFLYYGQKINVY